MLAYAGQGELVIEPVSLNAVVTETARLVQASLPQHATMSYDLAEAVPRTRADQSQLAQVFMNLLLNAAEALPESGGHVAVTTSVVELSQEELAASIQRPCPPPGRFVCLEVCDDGPGMALEVQERIFDPFYTTKFAGRGLGLAATLGTVRAHGGAVFLETGVGQGSRFRVVLPVWAAERSLGRQGSDLLPIAGGIQDIVNESIAKNMGL